MIVPQETDILKPITQYPPIRQKAHIISAVISDSYKNSENCTQDSMTGVPASDERGADSILNCRPSSLVMWNVVTAG